MGLTFSKQSRRTAKATKNAPTAKDMEAAKILYVELQCDWTANPDVKSMDDMKAMLGDGGATALWSGVEGLRHKYFTYNDEKDIVCGVYVFYSQDALEKYMASDLFKSHESFPHFSKVTAQVLDVMPGSELSIEKTNWKHTPATRKDVCQARMLVVDITMKYDTGVEGLPTCAADLYGFMAAPPAGMGYPGTFGELAGLRGKYFAYDDKISHCYGFYTFVDQKSLDDYMASDLFKTQGEPPHIEVLAYRTHEVLPGTERSLDIGNWGA